MKFEQAKTRAQHGKESLEAQAKQMQRREEYVHGKQDLPWAPDGIGPEHEELRRQSLANWTGLAVFAPIQRLRCEGVRTGHGAEEDKKVWRDFWHANHLESRQTIIYESMMTHGRGIGSVWVNNEDVAKPIMRPQSVRNVWLEPDADDPFRSEYAVKIVERKAAADNAFVVPRGTRDAITVAFVYDDASWTKLRLEGGAWIFETAGTHPMGRVPFVTFDYRPNANSEVFAPVDPLIAQQNAINTIRFNMLLAMQFSAFRQRVVTGYDPVMRDDGGQIVYKRNPDGTVYITSDGRKVPMLNEFGRAAVDRLLVFNGDQTKVFDMPESNLANYVTMLTEFLTQFFATAQVPPQYLLSRMANLSGDAISGAESTLTSLVGELKRYTNEGMVEWLTLAARAAGIKEPDADMEMLYADTEVKSFAQVVDGVQKLITSGFPRAAAWEMIPGANQPKVERWIEMADEEMEDALLRQFKEEVPGGDTSDDGGRALQRATSDLEEGAQV